MNNFFEETLPYQFYAVANLQMEDLENDMWIKTNWLVDDGRGLVDRALLPVKTVASQAETYRAVKSALTGVSYL